MWQGRELDNPVKLQNPRKGREEWTMSALAIKTVTRPTPASMAGRKRTPLGVRPVHRERFGARTDNAIMAFTVG